MSMCKSDDRVPYQKSRFFITSKKVGLPLYISPSRKVLKCLFQNIDLLLDLLYHNHNPLITTTVEDSIFLKKTRTREKNVGKILSLPSNHNDELNLTLKQIFIQMKSFLNNIVPKMI